MITTAWTSERDGTATHAAVVQYVSRKIGAGDRGFGSCRCLVVFDDGVFLGAVVFHNFEPMSNVIEISAAAESKRWLARAVLDRIFAYAFRDCCCQMVVARISENNTALHRIFNAYGFTSYRIPRLRGRNEDERIFTLTDDDWAAGKFYRSPEYGKTQDSRTAGSERDGGGADRHEHFDGSGEQCARPDQPGDAVWLPELQSDGQ